MTTSDDVLETTPGYVWTRRLHPTRSGQIGGIDGAVLAALRRGIGREAGTVAAMWPYYQHLNERGEVTRVLRAEHLVLTLFGVHQQSKRQPMHRAGVSVGAAMARLRGSDRFSTDAVERRFAAFATATSLTEAGTHLRGLVTQLREIDQVMDYTALLTDLVHWQNPERAGEVRRRWGLQFFVTKSKDDHNKSEEL
ncbi:type I-E CRISPR-associated protein Cse2/CasB [Pseudonocardia sp. CA-107938]|uniref:type I-E CRISPR-associated protein Cse2/CasB n=1 Tax=Pseudonocardia sp. CA-107938 TaxID=3240021 RepID=UPI003D8CC7CC